MFQFVQSDNTQLKGETEFTLTDVTQLKGEILIPLGKRFTHQKTINDINHLMMMEQYKEKLQNVQTFYEEIICHNKSHQKKLDEYRNINTIQQLENYMVSQNVTARSNCQTSFFQNVKMKNPLPNMQIAKQLERLQQDEEQKIQEQPDQFETFIKGGVLHVEVESSEIQKIKEKDVPSLVNQYLIKQNNLEKFLQNQIYLKQKFEETYVKIRILKKYNPSQIDVKLVVRDQIQQNILYGTNGIIYLDEKFEITSIKTDLQYKLYKIFEQKFIKEWELMRQTDFLIEAIDENKDYAFLAKKYLDSHMQNIKNIYIKTLNLTILIEELDFWIERIRNALNKQEIDIKIQDETIQFPQTYQQNNKDFDRLETYLSKSFSDIDAQQFQISEYVIQQSNHKMYFYKIQNDDETLQIEIISKGEKNTAYFVQINKNSEPFQGNSIAEDQWKIQQLKDHNLKKRKMDCICEFNESIRKFKKQQNDKTSNIISFKLYQRNR